MAARSLTRVALADLKLVSAPAERDYRIAAELLEVARQTDPGDQDILRLLIQAWTSAGDADRVDALNRELLALDPRDTVTQLSIVSSRISRLQNVDDRLTAYENFLGSKGEGIDPAIRSRLAMDAALLKRERGDDEGFARALTLACQLDPTNKDAATLALAFFSERVPDAVGRFELLTNVLKADPFDPEVHAAMAEELAAGGAVRGAERFYNTLARLHEARAEKMSPQESAEAIVSDWNTLGAEALIRRLTDQVENERAQLRARRDRIVQSGELLTQVADPSEVRLAVPFERSRVIAAASLGTAESIGYAIEEAAESIRRVLELLETPEKRPEGMSEEEAVTTARSLRLERVWLRLWSGRTTEEASAEFEALKADAQVDAQTLARLAAFLHLRQGRLQEAETELLSLAREDSLAAIGLGMLAEEKGQKDKAIELYTQLSRRLAGSIAGSFCRTRVIQLTGKPPAPTNLARKLQDLADAIPQSVEAMVTDPRRFMDVFVEVIGTETRLLDKIQMRFVIVNTSQFPMAVGPDKPINSRFLLAPIVDVGVQRLSLAGLQEVVWLNRRLRLMPGERFEATVWADSGVLGGILQRISGEAARLRWRVVQGFKLGDQGFYDTGPLCLSSETDTIQRSVTLRSGADASALAGWIEKGTTREMAESILAFIEQLVASAEAGTPAIKEEVDAVLAAAVARFRAADPAEKLLLLVLCPAGGQLRPFTALDLEAIKESDESILKFVLATRVSTADAPPLAADAWTSRPSLQAFADLLRDRLAEGAKTIATFDTRDAASQAPTPGASAPAGTSSPSPGSAAPAPVPAPAPPSDATSPTPPPLVTPPPKPQGG